MVRRRPPDAHFATPVVRREAARLWQAVQKLLDRQVLRRVVTGALAAWSSAVEAARKRRRDAFVDAMAEQMRSAKRCRIGLERRVWRHCPLQHSLDAWRGEVNLLRERRTWLQTTDQVLRRSFHEIAAVTTWRSLRAWQQSVHSSHSQRLCLLRDCTDTKIGDRSSGIDSLENDGINGPMNVWFPQLQSEVCSAVQLDDIECCQQAPLDSPWFPHVPSALCSPMQVDDCRSCHMHPVDAEPTWTTPSPDPLCNSGEKSCEVSDSVDIVCLVSPSGASLMSKEPGKLPFELSEASEMHTVMEFDRNLDGIEGVLEGHIADASSKAMPTNQSCRTQPGCMAPQQRGAFQRCSSAGRATSSGPSAGRMLNAASCARETPRRERSPEATNEFGSPRSTPVPITCATSTPRWTDRDMPRGPERLYYDKANYTGCARFSIGETPPPVRRGPFVSQPFQPPAAGPFAVGRRRSIR